MQPASLSPLDDTRAPDADHFALFGLPVRFSLDVRELEAAWRAVQARVHPDRFAAGSDAERRVAMMWASRANEAYRILRAPLSRARYLCELAGVDLQVETNTVMAPAFLMRQMEWREALAEARQSGDPVRIAALADELDAAHAEMARCVGELLDAGDAVTAGQRVREWMFIDRMTAELDAVSDT